MVILVTEIWWLSFNVSERTLENEFNKQNPESTVSGKIVILFYLGLELLW